MDDRRMAPWIEWKERCALALCTEATQAVLLAFGGMRFRTLAQRCLPLINVRDVKDVMVPDHDAWHLLETHMTVPQSSNGKAYKQWLFARADGSSDMPFDVIQGGATLLMRSVVREHLRREYSPPDHVSTHRTPGTAGDTNTIHEEWLPSDTDTRDTVARRELETIASREATSRFACLDRRSRLAMAARQLRVPLTTPALLTAGQCSKSSMHRACHHLADSLLNEVSTTYHGEDPATVNELALLIFETLTHHCVEWALQTPQYRSVLLTNTPASADPEAAL